LFEGPGTANDTMAVYIQNGRGSWRMSLKASWQRHHMRDLALMGKKVNADKGERHDKAANGGRESAEELLKKARIEKCYEMKIKEMKSGPCQTV